MGSIRTNLVENIELLGFSADLGGGASKEILLDFKDAAGGPFEIITALVGWAPGATPDVGRALRIEIFPLADGDPAGRRYRASSPEAAFAPFSEAVGNTAVNADSPAGQKVLYVASTAGFAVGDLVVIDPAGTGGGREFGMVAGIHSGVSLTLRDPLQYTHTAAADKVKRWQTRAIPVVAGGVGARLLVCTNEDTDPTDAGFIEVRGSGQAGFTTV